MYGLRYHLASLAAVFLALVLGVLLGTGINDRGLTNKAARALLERRVDLLSRELDQARADAVSHAREQRVAETFVSQTYPTLMANRLRGKRIAIVYVGAVDGTIESEIEQSLRDAGIVRVLRLRALKVPIDAKQIDATLAVARRTRPGFARYIGDAQLGPLGKALAQGLVTGKAALWQTLNEQVVEERDGGDLGRADGIVLVQTAPAQQDQTVAFLRGFYSGLTSSSAPVVAVETSQVTAGLPNLYGVGRISTVDDLDRPAGRLALALLLEGRQPGHYGIAVDASNGILPPVTPGPPG